MYFLDDFIWEKNNVARPFTINKNSALILQALSYGDVCQGNIGNCWFISTLINLIRHPHLLFKIIDFRQVLNANEKDYTGKITVNLKHKGSWQKIDVDDRLAYKNNMPIYGHNASNPDELWMAYIEKAYAYIHGKKYSTAFSPTGGTLLDALDEFGLEVIVDSCLTNIGFLKFLNMLSLVSKNNKFGMLCGVYGDTESILPSNIVTCHAYSIIYVDAENNMLVKNPWAKYDFKNKIRHLPDANIDDGIFWISPQDFYKNFNHICLYREQEFSELLPPSSLYLFYAQEHIHRLLYGSVFTLYIMIQASTEVCLSVITLDGTLLYTDVLDLDFLKGSVFKMTFNLKMSQGDLALKIRKNKNDLLYFISNEYIKPMNKLE